MDFNVEEIKKDMPIPLSMLSISFLEKLPYKGSYKGKRFMFKKHIDKLNVYVWEDRFNFENTKDDMISTKEFNFTKEGIEEGLKYVSECQINCRTCPF